MEKKTLREQMEENHKASQALEKEPKNVVAKSYFQGEPTDLINITNSMINSLKPKRQGEKPGRYALTIMIENITPNNS